MMRPDTLDLLIDTFACWNSDSIALRKIIGEVREREGWGPDDVEDVALRLFANRLEATQAVSAMVVEELVKLQPTTLD